MLGGGSDAGGGSEQSSETPKAKSRGGKKRAAQEVKQEDGEDSLLEDAAPAPKKKRGTKIKPESFEDIHDLIYDTPTRPKSGRPAKASGKGGKKVGTVVEGADDEPLHQAGSGRIATSLAQEDDHGLATKVKTEQPDEEDAMVSLLAEVRAAAANCHQLLDGKKVVTAAEDADDESDAELVDVFH